MPRFSWTWYSVRTVSLMKSYGLTSRAVQVKSALQESMAAEGINAYYVTDPFNLRYISGFTGTSGTALITANNAYFITDFRYREQAKAQCAGY